MPAPVRMTRRTAALWMFAAGRAAAHPLHPDLCPARLPVLCTTSDLASLAAAVGGDSVRIRTLVSPSADAESFEPRASDLALVSEAALIVRVGLGYDSWLEKLLDRARRAGMGSGPDAMVDASAGIPLLEVHGRDPFSRDAHAHGLANPHYWFDPGNAETITANIAAAIASRSPCAAEAVIEKRDRFLVQLRQKMDAWARRLAPCRGAAVLAYHNTWPYFARRFHLNVVGFVEPREGVTPSVAHLARLLWQARQSHVRAVLRTSNEPARLAQAAAAHLGVPVVQLAPAVGGAPQTGDYLSFMDFNVDVLARALGAAP